MTTFRGYLALLIIVLFKVSEQISTTNRLSFVFRYRESKFIKNAVFRYFCPFYFVLLTCLLFFSSFIIPFSHLSTLTRMITWLLMFYFVQLFSYNLCWVKHFYLFAHYRLFSRLKNPFNSMLNSCSSAFNTAISKINSYSVLPCPHIMHCVSPISLQLVFCNLYSWYQSCSRFYLSTFTLPSQSLFNSRVHHERLKPRKWNQVPYQMGVLHLSVFVFYTLISQKRFISFPWSDFGYFFRRCSVWLDQCLHQQSKVIRLYII